jgi:hypothetical protein
MLAREEFRSVVSQVDDVEYPFILQPLPRPIIDHVVSSLSILMMQNVRANHIFARMMPEGVKAPHMVHEDSNMGQFAAHIYLSDVWPVGTGTEFCIHKEFGPHNGGIGRHLGEGHKTMDDWEPYLFVQAKANRCMVHGTEYYHRALPTEGFGKDVNDARLVITCFFNVI